MGRVLAKITMHGMRLREDAAFGMSLASLAVLNIRASLQGPTILYKDQRMEIAEETDFPQKHILSTLDESRNIYIPVKSEITQLSTLFWCMACFFSAKLRRSSSLQALRFGCPSIRFGSSRWPMDWRNVPSPSSSSAAWRKKKRRPLKGL